MHYVTDVRYVSGYKLRLQFGDGTERLADLEGHLDGEVFEPLQDPVRFRTARLNRDVDTVVWDNGADMSPDFLYEISVPQNTEHSRRVAEGRARYGETDKAEPAQQST
jgi:hypothetical protein